MSQSSPHPSSQGASDTNRVSSVLIVGGASLTKRNGGGVRSRVVMATLQELGPVHVISVVAKKRHIDRVETVPGAASQSTIVASGTKDPSVSRAIKDLIQQDPNIRIVTLRYFKTWQMSGLEHNPPDPNILVWLDLDDRDDQIVLGKRQNSRFWLQRLRARSLANARKREVETAAHASSVCSLASAADTDDFAPGANVFALPNVVPDVPKHLRQHKASHSASILFVGAFDWPPNAQAIEWFISRCWPGIKASHPAAELHVVGGGSRPQRDALAAKFADAVGITWHFDVPDLGAVYADSRLVISPVTLGSGSKIKVIEAAAFERPVVVTPHSARGLHSDMQDALKIADTPENFSAACLAYLNDPQSADTAGARLFGAQQKHHSAETFKRTALQALGAVDHTLRLPSEYALAPQPSNEVHT